MSIENQLGAVSHEDWMRRALSIASKGMREDEVPIGAIVVYKGNKEVARIVGQTDKETIYSAIQKGI